MYRIEPNTSLENCKGFTVGSMAGTFDNSAVMRIQQANDIVDVVSEYMSLARKGKEMVGLCPFHEDHRPSMYVSGVKQIFKCFACGAGGDVFKFIQMRENLTFPQAIERLAERAGIKIKAANYTKSQTKDQPPDVDPNMLAKVNEWVAKYFQKNLADKEKGKSARDYIAERQISPKSVKQWRIGLAVSGNDLIKAANAKGIATKLLAQAGVVVGQRDGGFGDKFVNRLMFPIADVTGRVVGFGGRTLDGADAKYVNSPTTVLFDKSNCLYGLEHARTPIASGEVAIVVEGYTDCLMAHQFGCNNVIATLGTSLTAGHGRMLRRYAKKVILLFDSDIAGLEAANRALDVCIGQRIDIKLASVPEGKDPCDFILAAGKKGFEQLVERAVDVFEFKWNRLVDNFDGSETFVDKKRAIEEFLQTIAVSLRAGGLPAIEKGLIVNRLSKIIGTDSKEINAELSRRVSRAARAGKYSDTITSENQKVQSVDLGQGLFAAAQREVLEVVLNEPALFEDVKQNVTVETFDVPILREIAGIVFETLNREPDAPLAAILAKTESVEVGQYVVELAEGGEEKGNFRIRLAGALGIMQRYQTTRKNSRIEEIKDQAQFLRRVHENTGKHNPHNLGMV